MNVTTLSKVETLRHFISSQNEELKKTLVRKTNNYRKELAKWTTHSNH